ncbi:MAG: ribosome recycling factor [Chloroflexota bacterium]|jgi:ribosome recycling factor|nr:ribosome recycling factor [Chloroflexota bacterium]
MPVDEVHSATQEKMQKSIEALRHELASIRTGRASPAILDRVMVDYFGNPTPVNALASISAPEPRLITIQPWDRQALGAIEKAIQKSDLGLNPTNDGQIIRLAIPALNDDRRRELVKMVHTRLEESRVAIRNQRRDAIEHLRKEEKEKLVSEDDVKRGQDRLQKLTDQFIGQVDEIGKAKEREILETS